MADISNMDIFVKGTDSFPAEDARFRAPRRRPAVKPRGKNPPASRAGGVSLLAERDRRVHSEDDPSRQVGAQKPGGQHHDGRCAQHHRIDGANLEQE